MKKKFFALLLSAALLLCALPLVFAEGGTDASGNSYVSQQSEYISAAEQEELNNRAEEISELYGVNTYIAVFDNMGDYGYEDAAEFAMDVFEQNGCGVGESEDGVMLMLSMGDRDYAVIAHGDIGNSYITDYGRGLIVDAFLDDFRSNDWYSGFEHYLDKTEELLEAGVQGTPVDIEPGEVYNPTEYKPTVMDYVRGIVIMWIPSFGIALVLSFIYCSAQKSKMKTAVAATQAHEYIAENGISVRTADDVFTHTTEHRERIQRETKSSGGGHGGGTTTNSRGFSSSSGKF